MILAIIAIIISGVALGVSYAAIQRSNKRYERQQRHIFCMDCRLTCIYINQLHHYIEQLINDERYEEAAKVKLIIQKEEAAAHEIFGLNF